ncbi:MAG TPA: CbtB-domain containing protein [Mycobacteriales bacterium]
MSSISLPNRKPKVAVSPEAISTGRVALILGITIFLALAVYYFVGIDEGVTSLFGKSMVIHEWVHDSRHFLGFPCH